MTTANDFFSSSCLLACTVKNENNKTFISSTYGGIATHKIYTVEPVLRFSFTLYVRFGSFTTPLFYFLFYFSFVFWLFVSSYTHRVVSHKHRTPSTKSNARDERRKKYTLFYVRLIELGNEIYTHFKFSAFSNRPQFNYRLKICVKIIRRWIAPAKMYIGNCFCGAPRIVFVDTKIFFFFIWYCVEVWRQSNTHIYYIKNDTACE